jgi:hypothetical protein
LEALFKLASARDLTSEETHALTLFENASSLGVSLFVVPPTDNVLARLALSPAYAPLIAFFRSHTEVIVPARYFKRWARRLRKHGFTREDAAVLALGTFGTDQDAGVLGTQFVATYDQPMINHWLTQQASIQSRLAAMQPHLRPPYSRSVALPVVRRPEDILMLSPGAPKLHERAVSYDT